MISLIWEMNSYKVPSLKTLDDKLYGGDEIKPFFYYKKTISFH